MLVAARGWNPGDSRLATVDRLTADTITFGTLALSQTASAILKLHNSGVKTVRVTRVETSCPCVSVSSLPIQVPAGSSASLQAAFDPSEDPDFRGSLAVEVLGRGADSAVVFHAMAVVKVEVGGGSRPRVSDRRGE